ncbi:DNA alkylation repair protein [Pseudalkalibacillus berkeleyi]|uniref:DNA alkylation repair protein n=1 Tax=Pseudalkalibacillus berkeleyi TaxID=1069813 RepID=A0ABS9GZ44_9BACL|nr:DNA alkylation repair protein [Pseudalkalibacillus berkeleyi]MCF6136763.1 DNA alkylation repair protein [Pseudalkalibacillus berkeleyi]
MREWKKSFENALNFNGKEEVVDLLEEQKTLHAGTAPAKVKRLAIKLIEQKCMGNEIMMNEWAYFLAKHQSPTAKEIAAHLLVNVYENDKEPCHFYLYYLADDHHWEVREWAAGACGSLLAAHYASFYPVLNEWIQDNSENVRRVVVLAVMYASKSLTSRYVRELLHLFEPLMCDNSAYVKKNLGPFAIGDALLSRFPDEVLAWLEHLSESENEHVRWNIAMVFTSAASRKFKQPGFRLLSSFANDERKPIQRAVKKAKENLENGQQVASK